jgi:hypothetical protein
MDQFQKSISPEERNPSYLQSNWDLGWLLHVYQENNCDKFGNTSECCSEIWVHLGASGSAGLKPGSAGNKPGSGGNKPGVPNNKPGSILVDRRKIWARLPHGSEHIELHESSHGKISSFETALWGLIIIATSYQWTTFKTHVCSLYSHLCINIATPPQET